jgi:hypothetical protein
MEYTLLLFPQMVFFSEAKYGSEKLNGSESPDSTILCDTSYQNFLLK